MGTGRNNVRVTRLGRFVRGRRPDRNPLRRRSDRAETAVLVLLVIVFIAAAPFTALACGGWARAMAHQAQLSQEASWHQVPALVLTVSSGAQGGGGYGGLMSQAQARWTAPDGKVVTGEIPVPFGTAAGTTLRLWTTDDGQLTDPPLQDSQVSGSAYFAATFAVIVLAGLLAGIGLLARKGLDRRRMAAWDAEWRVTGPRWTTRA
jgi:hypothetical protein